MTVKSPPEAELPKLVPPTESVYQTIESPVAFKFVLIPKQIESLLTVTFEGERTAGNIDTVTKVLDSLLQFEAETFSA